MIEVKNISKKFNNNVVLNGIDLNINKGDVVAIIGPSGTGKSTFLRCLNRLEKPESGSIIIMSAITEKIFNSFLPFCVNKNTTAINAIGRNPSFSHSPGEFAVVGKHRKHLRIHSFV